jgi:hypothetical protein
MKLRPDIIRLIESARSTANVSKDVSYPSRVSAQHVRGVILQLADALEQTETERRRLAEELCRAHGHEISDSLV